MIDETYLTDCFIDLSFSQLSLGYGNRSQQNTIAYQQAEHYLNVDFMNSLRKMKKSEAFLKTIQAENQEILQNSYVLLAYDPKNPDTAIGGAVFAVARRPSEWLLLENELKENFFEKTLKPEFPIAEVARVSVTAPPLRSNIFTLTRPSYIKDSIKFLDTIPRPMQIKSDCHSCKPEMS